MVTWQYQSVTDSIDTATLEPEIVYEYVLETNMETRTFFTGWEGAFSKGKNTVFLQYGEEKNLM